MKKFTVNFKGDRNVFVTALPSKYTMPILNYFKMSVIDKKLSIMSTNLDGTLIYDIDVDATDNMEFLMPGKFFLNIIRNHKASDIVVTLMDTDGEIMITADEYCYRTNEHLSVEMFPLMPSCSNDYLMEMDHKNFSKIVKVAIPFTSRYLGRPIYTGVLFRQYAGGDFHVVATNGYVLYEETLVNQYTNLQQEGQVNVVIPQATLRLLCKFKNIKTNINFFYEKSSETSGGRRIECYLDNIRVVSYTIDGLFPNWQNAYSTEKMDVYLNYEFEKKQLLDISKRLLPFVSENSYKLIHQYEYNLLKIIVESRGVTVNHQIPIVNDNKDCAQYGVNCIFFIKCLSVFDDDEVITLMVSKDANQVLIFTGKNKKVVLMPLSTL